MAIDTTRLNLVAFATVAETGITDARTVLASAQTSLDQAGTAAADDLAATTDLPARRPRARLDQTPT